MSVSRMPSVRPLTAVALTALLFTVACKRPEPPSEGGWRVERGRSESTSVKSVSQTRSVENFTAVELRGAGEIVVTVGAPAALQLEGRERTLERVDTRVTGETLIIDVAKTRGWFSDYGRLKITIAMPELKSLESNGAGEIKITGLNGGEQRLRLAGAHEVKAEGTLDRLDVEVSGAGSVDYGKVIATEAKVRVNGAGSVEVHVTEALDAQVNGVGAVHYGGDPKKVESNLHGLGSIRRR
jgi:hypothetical protein